MGDQKKPAKPEPPEEQIERNQDRIRKALLSLRAALAKESQETKEMLEIYFRFTQGKATKEELKKAEDQLQDVIKAMGLTVFGILPLAPITIPVIVKLGQRFGIEILPSAFREKAEDDSQ